jgi:hypothetical protein
MEELLKNQPAAVVLACFMLFEVVKFIFEQLKKKNELSEKSIESLTNALQSNTLMMSRLEARISEAERNLAELPKFKLDVRRVFTAVRLLAGENWDDIRKVIMDEL